jgi:hypothetical protein
MTGPIGLDAVTHYHSQPMSRDQLRRLERDLWAAADKLRANSDLKATTNWRLRASRK